MSMDGRDESPGDPGMQDGISASGAPERAGHDHPGREGPRYDRYEEPGPDHPDGRRSHGVGGVADEDGAAVADSVRIPRQGRGSLPPSDADLIVRLHSGDDSAYAELFRRHAPAIRRYAGTCCRDAHTADDLTAEVFARVLQAVRGGAGPRYAVRAYLLAAVRRVAADWAKSARREQLVDDFAVFAAQAARRADGPHDPTLDLGADVLALQEAEQSLAAQAFRSLPERWQAVLWHTEVEDESPGEVAALFGLDANGTRVLASRAREGLRRAYLQAHVSAALTADEGCARYADRLGTYARGGLRSRAERGLRKHLAECARCRLAAGQIKEVAQGIPGVVPVAVIGWFGAAGYGKVAALFAGGAAGGGGAATAAATGGSSGYSGPSGATTHSGAAGSSSAPGSLGTAGPSSTAGTPSTTGTAGSAGHGGASGGGGATVGKGAGVSAPVKAGVTAAVAAAAAAVMTLALLDADTAPQRRPAAKPPASQPQHPSPTATSSPELPPIAGPMPTPPASRTSPTPSPKPQGTSAPTPTSQLTPEPTSPGGSTPPQDKPTPQPSQPTPKPPPSPVPVSYPLSRLKYAVLGDGHAPEIRTDSSWLWRRQGMHVGHRRYAQGATVHGASSVTVNLNRTCTSFDAYVGVDDTTLGLGSVRFSVFGDGVRVWRSPVVDGGDRAVPMHVALVGRRTVRLVVTPQGVLDTVLLADWAQARFTCR